MEALEQFDEDVRVRVPTPAGEKPKPLVPLRAESVIANGIYTLTFPDGSHKTLKIRRIPDNSKFAPGQRTLSLLVGPDNSSDYEQFAFVTEQRITVWKGKRGGLNNPSKFERYAFILWEIAVNNEQFDGYELAVSKTCLRCNRTLTTPESIATGLGPECVKHARAPEPLF